MNNDVIFRYINGRIVPIKVNKDKTTNQYMNDKIRNKKENDEEVTLYHGSPYKFDKFDLEKARQNQQYVNIDQGHYFTDDEEIAREMYGQDGYVYEVRVPKGMVKRSGTYLGQGDYEDKIFVVNDDDAIKIVKRNKINKYYNKYNVKEELDNINRKIRASEKLYNEFKDNPDFIKDYNAQKERKEWLDSIPKYEDGKPASIKTKLYSINEDIKKVKNNIKKQEESDIQEYGKIHKYNINYSYLNDRLQELERRKKQLERQSKE